jgi:hypothetical protein
MRSVFLILSLLVAAAPCGAQNLPAVAAASGDDVSSFGMPGFDLGSVQTFGFAQYVGSCLVDLTLGLGSLGILAADDGPADVVADCMVAEGGDTLSVTAISLSDPETHRVVWWGFDVSPAKDPAAKFARVIGKLRTDRLRRAEASSSPAR